MSTKTKRANEITWALDPQQGGLTNRHIINRFSEGTESAKKIVSSQCIVLNRFTDDFFQIFKDIKTGKMSKKIKCSWKIN